MATGAPVKTLTELREWNLAHAKDGAIRFGQSRLDISDEMDVERDRARNDADTAKDHRLSRDQGIDAVLKAHKLDAILTPGGSGANLASRAGYPIIAVPFGMVPNAPTPPLAVRLRCEAGAVRRHLHGRRLRGAEARRARVRVRAGEQEAGAASGHAVSLLAVPGNEPGPLLLQRDMAATVRAGAGAPAARMAQLLVAAGQGG